MDSFSTIKLDHEFEEWLKQQAAPPKFTGDIPAMRKMLSDAKKRMTLLSGVTQPPEGIEERDITITVRDGYEIPVRVYRPIEPPPDGSPLIILYHGGGFILGDLLNEELNSRNFAKAFNAVCLNVDYRLAPENPFPTPVNDCWDVLSWAAANAPALQADPSKGFLLFGVSAGGNLSAIMAHIAREKSLSPPLTGIALAVPLLINQLDPPEALRSELKSYEENADAPFLDKEKTIMFLEAYGFDPSSKLFSPFAGPEKTWDFRDLPPTMIWACGADPLRDDGIAYERLLRENNVKTKLTMYPGLPHSFWSFAPSLSSSKKAIGDFVEGMRWLLSKEEDS